jgi:ElaB/YqjD/DUF883 family membrane-anchored ribosome-binding protein
MIADAERFMIGRMERALNNAVEGATRVRRRNMAEQNLPEGTDAVIEGAGVSEDDEVELAGADEMPAATTTTDQDPVDEEPVAAQTAQTGSGETGSPAAAFFDRVQGLRGQAEDRARDFAQAGKDRALSALDDVVRMVEDAAAEIDDKLGSQYGDYARRAAEGIGGVGDAFRDKDVDELFDDARALVTKAPAVAVGVAAALGFVVARVVRAGLPADAADAPKA